VLEVVCIATLGAIDEPFVEDTADGPELEGVVDPVADIV
jgi:hypothetical protein